MHKTETKSKEEFGGKYNVGSRRKFPRNYYSTREREREKQCNYETENRKPQIGKIRRIKNDHGNLQQKF